MFNVFELKLKLTLSEMLTVRKIYGYV